MCLKSLSWLILLLNLKFRNVFERLLSVLNTQHHCPQVRCLAIFFNGTEINNLECLILEKKTDHDQGLEKRRYIARLSFKRLTVIKH